jgi:hypothetical protein
VPARCPVWATWLYKWAGEDSNLRPTDYESAALTTELPALCVRLWLGLYSSKAASEARGAARAPGR